MLKYQGHFFKVLKAIARNSKGYNMYVEA